MYRDSKIDTFEASTPGPNLLVFGGIDGKGKSGVDAIEHFSYLMDEGLLYLSKGSLTLACGNVQALRKGKSYISHDMNKLFHDQEVSEDCMNTQEYIRAQVLKALFVGKDAFLDLHSLEMDSPDMIFAEAYSLGLAMASGVEFVVTDPKMFIAKKGTPEYFASSLGIKVLTFYAGSQGMLPRRDSAYKMIANFAAYYEVCDFAKFGGESKVLEIQDEIVKSTEFDSLLCDLNNLERVNSGSLVVDSPMSYTAKEDGYLLFPVDPANISVGERIALFATEV